MPYDKALGTFFYMVSYKNSTPAFPILLADFTKLFSSIAIFGLIFDERASIEKGFCMKL
ncbi:MAG TPA: hypothetical protein HPP56_02735 [Nitrospirae bacterium]|nr:hypothetical protein [Nitrospirota bacterium]